MSLSSLARASFFILAAGTVLLLERTRRARRPIERPSVHDGRNLVFAGLAAATVHLLEAPVVVPLARTVARRRWGLVHMVKAPDWMRGLMAVLLLDYTLYFWHIVVHRVPWLWRFHLVHHLDLDLNASTGLRFHAGELAASIPWRAAQIVAIGATPSALNVWQTLTIASVLFHHSNTRLSGRSERVLSWLVATPGMHAIHHSTNPAQLQSNFSSGLAIWDRIHGTVRLDADPADVRVGVIGHLDPEDAALGRSLALPFSARSLAPVPHA